ncbi:MAG: T9SS type A sorting domain-containing protein [Calditrichia bacterium]
MGRILPFILLLYISQILGNINSVKIIWKQNKENDLYGYVIERDVNETGVYLPLGNTLHPDTVFVDDDVEPGILYLYRVAAVDSSGKQSPYSFSASLGIPKITPDLPAVPSDSINCIPLENIVSDPNNPVSYLSVEVLQSENIQVSVQNGNLCLQAVHPGYIGTASFVLKASDPNSFYDIDTVQVQFVLPAPVISSMPDVVVPDNMSASLPLDSFVNYSGDLSSLSWNGQIIEVTPAGVSPSVLQIALDSLDHRVQFSFSDNSAITAKVLFTVESQGGYKDSDTLCVMTEAANNPPAILQPLPACFLREDHKLVLPLQYWYSFLQDPQTPASMLALQFWGNANISAQVQGDSLFLQPAPDWFGEEQIKIIVNDGFLRDSAAFYTTVYPVNDPPEIHGLPNELHFASDTLSLDLWSVVRDKETADSLLNYQFTVSSDSLLPLYNPATGRLLLQFTSRQSWQADVAIRISDPQGAVVLDTVAAYRKISDLHSNILQTAAGFQLYQNHPNPFNPATVINYDIPSSGRVRISIYNILGEKVSEPVNEIKPAGRHQVVFQAGNFASGLYFYVLEAGSFRQVKKMMIAK